MEEERLLTTGEFARRGLLSPKALRLYDRQGLLPPDRIDPDSGYRYYRPERLATARLIVRLRGLDMPLATVAEVLALPGPRRPSGSPRTGTPSNGGPPRSGRWPTTSASN
ncbi:MerR family transcriptional regulator [Kitasatospora cheerisanensis]|uniref:MerR family transcriptional regulator n=1 Tax=Kitasatospora cheerisanensis KCTC 2395 TaxID=1348663 RepID=A0A066YUT3_9ACTN|nr:MerR family transcriptional regulator [Kitasatospora cheerisanensis KCTC 2395]